MKLKQIILMGLQGNIFLIVSARTLGEKGVETNNKR